MDCPKITGKRLLPESRPATCCVIFWVHTGPRGAKIRKQDGKERRYCSARRCGTLSPASRANEEPGSGTDTAPACVPRSESCTTLTGRRCAYAGGSISHSESARFHGARENGLASGGFAREE